jgi:hypothetical protein
MRTRNTLATIALLTHNQSINSQIRTLHPDALALNLKSEAQAGRYFTRHIIEIDTLFIDLDSISPETPLVLLLTLLRTSHPDLEIFVMSDDITRLMDTTLEVNHWIVLPIGSSTDP